MKKTRRLGLALLVAGFLMVPQVSSFYAEELSDGTAVGEEVAEEAAEESGEETSVVDSSFEDSANPADFTGSASDIQLTDYSDYEPLITGREEAMKISDELFYAGALSSDSEFQEDPLLYYREILENGFTPSSTSSKKWTIEKFALFYLDNNDLPELAIYSPGAVRDKEVLANSHSGFLMNGYGSRITYSLMEKEQEVFYYPKMGIIEILTIDSDDYNTYFKVITADSALGFEKHQRIRTSDRYYYQDGRHISEEQYNSLYNTYVANNSSKRTPVPWVANTAANRDRYLGVAQPVVSAPVQGLYNSSNGGDLRWSPVPGVDNYMIYRTNGGKTEKIATVGKDKTSYMDTSIKDNCWGKVYTYYVCSQVGDKISKRENGVVLQRIAPMKINYNKNDKASAITIKWGVSTGSNKANGYELQYATSKTDLFGQKGSFKKVSINGRNNLTKTISGLTKGKTYYFRVRAYVNYTHSVTKKTTKTLSQYSDVKSVKITK